MEINAFGVHEPLMIPSTRSHALRFSSGFGLSLSERTQRRPQFDFLAFPRRLTFPLSRTDSVLTPTLSLWFALNSWIHFPFLSSDAFGFCDSCQVIYVVFLLRTGVLFRLNWGSPDLSGSFHAWFWFCCMNSTALHFSFELRPCDSCVLRCLTFGLEFIVLVLFDWSDSTVHV